MVSQTLNKDRVSEKRLDLILCLAVCLPALALFLFISLYNHPIGDDFWCTGMVRKYGYWNAQLRLYDIVPPRYLELAISCLTPLSFGNFSGYKVIPILFILVFIYLMAGFFKTLGGKNSYRDTILPAMLFVAGYLCILPGLAEGIYWASALSVYHTGILLFIVWCNYMLKWYYAGRKPFYLLVVCLSLAGILGCNELISVVTLTVFFVIFLLRWSRKKGVDGLLAAQLIVTASCLCFIFRYKGTGNRYSLIKGGDSGRLFYSMGYALVIDGFYICRALINPFFWATAVAGYGVFRRLVFSSVVRSFLQYRLWFFAVWVFVLMVIPFAIIYITGDRPPLRICNMIVFFFFFGLTGWVGLLGGLKNRAGLSKHVFITVVCLLIAGLILPNNVSLTARDLYSGNAREYDKGWNQRIGLIKGCKEDSCIVPPLKQIPFVFRFEPDVDEPHISEYFDKKIIVR
jgi:hypothetical protein